MEQSRVARSSGLARWSMAWRGRLALEPLRESSRVITMRGVVLLLRLECTVLRLLAGLCRRSYGSQRTAD
jgi:hypothetical protein